MGKNIKCKNCKRYSANPKYYHCYFCEAGYSVCQRCFDTFEQVENEFLHRSTHQIFSLISQNCVFFQHLKKLKNTMFNTQSVALSYEIYFTAYMMVWPTQTTPFSHLYHLVHITTRFCNLLTMLKRKDLAVVGFTPSPQSKNYDNYPSHPNPCYTKLDNSQILKTSCYKLWVLLENHADKEDYKIQHLISSLLRSSVDAKQMAKSLKRMSRERIPSTNSLANSLANSPSNSLDCTLSLPPVVDNTVVLQCKHKKKLYCRLQEGSITCYEIGDFTGGNLTSGISLICSNSSNFFTVVDTKSKGRRGNNTF
eukprot:TRINITY_DN1516_c0_g2_i19.p2 TRINITY_DN1516_c0_g2~~TRINITY_DN1516_c0_g2_i19.p2  ORF type:complete len:309 (-),score=47.15 TRINITY_DN1516_c0_g2_i19:101-1027(-)